MRIKLTKKSLIKQLKSNGIRQGTGEWNQYEYAKSVITGGNNHIDNYEEVMRWVSEWINV